MNSKTPFQPAIGILIILLGFGFLLNSLNIYNFAALLSDWWPLIIIAFAVMSIITNPRTFIWPLFAIVGATLLILRQTGVVEFDIWNLLWPSAIIVAGASILFGKLTPKNTRLAAQKQTNFFAALSGVQKNITGEFTGGSVTVLMGGISLDLRNAKIKDGAIIDIFTVMGGVELKVPTNCIITTNIFPLMGGVEDKTSSPNEKNGPTLIVRGTCVMGGVELRD